jgi:hypothetical protein
MTRTSRCIGPLLALLTLAIAPRAVKAELHTKGTATLSIDRLFGFSHNKLTAPLAIGDGEASTSRTDLSLLLSSNASISIYTRPRLGADFTITDLVTIGGSLGFASVSTSSSATALGVTTETEDDDGLGFILAPRAGFVLPIAGPTYLWLRGGFTYFQVPIASQTTLYGFSFNFEPTLAFMLAGQLGITMSGLIDLPLAGEAKTELANGGTATREDVTLRNLGLVVGIAVTL